MKKLIKSLLVALLVLSLAGCESSKQQVPELLEPVGLKLDTQTVVKDDIIVVDNYLASVTPYIQEVCSVSGGNIQTSNIKLGDEVKKGDLIATIDVTSLSKKINSLQETIETTKTNNSLANQKYQIEIDIAKLEYENLLEQKNKYDDYYKELEALNQNETSSNEPTLEKPQGEEVTESELFLAKNKVEEKELLLKQQKQTQSMTISQLNVSLQELKATMIEDKIVAPCSGSVVYYNNLLQGDSVSANKTFVCIEDSTKLFVQTEYLPQSTIKIAKKLEALINGKRYEIEYIPMDDTEYFKLYFAGNDIYSSFKIKGDTSELTTGEFANIELYTTVLEDVLVVPINTIVEEKEGQSYIYKVENGSLVKTAVTLGKKNDTYIEVTTGLKEGDNVYVGD